MKTPHKLIDICLKALTIKDKLIYWAKILMISSYPDLIFLLSLIYLSYLYARYEE